MDESVSHHDLMAAHLDRGALLAEVVRLRALASKLAKYVDEWDFEDGPVESNSCRSCGWSTKEDWDRESPGLHHHAKCDLRLALDAVGEFDEDYSRLPGNVDDG